jgi:hypothetical protein
MEFTDHSGTSHKIAWNGDERADIFFFFDPYSQESILGLSFLESIFNSVGQYGVRIFAIEASGLDEEDYARTMERYHRLYGEPSFPVVLDPKYQMSKLFGIEVTPSTYLLQRHGVTLYRATDFTEADAVSFASRVERLAEIYERQGKLESAIIQWQEVLNLKPGHTKADNRIKNLQSLQDRGGTGETGGKP